MFTFTEICDSTFGASDYIALGRNYSTIIVKNIPKINLDNKSAARRLILLIDEMYNHNTKLYCSA